MQQRLSETTFPWILSNVDDHHTGLPLANLPRTFRLTRGGLTLGILGLAGLDWVSTLATLSSDRVHATDYVAAANNLCATDGNLQDVDAVVALTHMRQPDDLRLARDAERVDLLLGGHDHIMWKRKVNDRWVVKSGSDFKVCCLSYFYVFCCCQPVMVVFKLCGGGGDGDDYSDSDSHSHSDDDSMGKNEKRMSSVSKKKRRSEIRFEILLVVALLCLARRGSRYAVGAEHKQRRRDRRYAEQDDGRLKTERVVPSTAIKRIELQTRRHLQRLFSVFFAVS